MARPITQPMLILATVMMIVANAPVDAQTATAGPPPGIAVSIAMKAKVPVGQSPWVVLTVENISDRDVVIHDYMWRLHVEGEKGEPPTTLVQRCSTGKLRPGDAACPRADEQSIWSIFPGLSSDQKYKLTYFYDLSAPGKYTVYMEVIDPISKKSLRTNTLNFEMQSPSK